MAADGFEPSGALVKAMLINSATPLRGTMLGFDGPWANPLRRGVDDYDGCLPRACIGRGPSIGLNYPVSDLTAVQGFGRVQLNNVLYFVDNFGLSLWVTHNTGTPPQSPYTRPPFASFACAQSSGAECVGETQRFRRANRIPIVSK